MSLNYKVIKPYKITSKPKRKCVYNSRNSWWKCEIETFGFPLASLHFSLVKQKSTSRRTFPKSVCGTRVHIHVLAWVPSSGFLQLFQSKNGSAKSSSETMASILADDNFFWQELKVRKSQMVNATLNVESGEFSFTWISIISPVRESIWVLFYRFILFSKPENTILSNLGQLLRIKIVRGISARNRWILSGILPPQYAVLSQFSSTQSLFFCWQALANMFELQGYSKLRKE